jgi:hypothetical protein
MENVILNNNAISVVNRPERFVVLKPHTSAKVLDITMSTNEKHYECLCARPYPEWIIH